MALHAMGLVRLQASRGARGVARPLPDLVCAAGIPVSSPACGLRLLAGMLQQAVTVQLAGSCLPIWSKGAGPCIPRPTPHASCPMSLQMELCVLAQLSGD